MARHRCAFKPNNPAPFELSRSKVETFISCKGCFWLDRVAGIKPPEMPSFTINTTTDILLKRDADAVRGQSTLPLWEANGLGNTSGTIGDERISCYTDSLGNTSCR